MSETREMRRVVTICNERGLHARAAAKFVRTVEEYDAEVVVWKGDTDVIGSSIMGLLMLAAGPGTELELVASGKDGTALLDAIETLVNDRFHEEV
tara:strand:- start:250 stop:534 length:285 start_codon:yes stop_codon:yes gene_type:complete